ncbi:MAG TPA: hypothetical protein VGG10_19015 [Rhizomicrobium sp.]|jgi:hypothetical protein
MNEPEQSQPGAGRMASGMALIVIGLLILIPSGLCSAIFGAGAFMSAISGSTESALNDVPEILLVGGPFIVVGLLLFLAGRRLRRRG